jgi:hypothetical protein
MFREPAGVTYTYATPRRSGVLQGCPTPAIATVFHAIYGSPDILVVPPSNETLAHETLFEKDALEGRGALPCLDRNSACCRWE